MKKEKRIQHSLVQTDKPTKHKGDKIIKNPVTDTVINTAIQEPGLNETKVK